MLSGRWRRLTAAILRRITMASLTRCLTINQRGDSSSKLQKAHEYLKDNTSAMSLKKKQYNHLGARLAV
jgi:hypothetical protein